MIPISRIEGSGIGKEIGGNRQLGTSPLIHRIAEVVRDKLGIDADEGKGAGQFGLWILEAALELENQNCFLAGNGGPDRSAARHSDPRRWPR